VPIRRGWCLGEETFRQELLGQMSERMGGHYGEERTETAAAEAEQIIARELQRRRWKEADLKTRPQGDPTKVALSGALAGETTMTVEWIAARFGMGTRGPSFNFATPIEMAFGADIQPATADGRCAQRGFVQFIGREHGELVSALTTMQLACPLRKKTFPSAATGETLTLAANSLSCQWARRF